MKESTKCMQRNLDLSFIYSVSYHSFKNFILIIYEILVIRNRILFKIENGIFDYFKVIIKLINKIYIVI